MAAKSTKSTNKQAKRKLPRCKACDRPIRIPQGWSTGAAVRRHYWSKHRAVMLEDGRGS
ncbi:MAG: hypothetical protein ACRDK3_16740 [Actinomycetota bacterium]